MASKVAFVTGAGSGIGRATAQLFASRDYAVALVDVSEKGLQETEASIQNAGGECAYFVCDVSDDASVAEWAGHSVLVVPGDPRNLKVTGPADLPSGFVVLIGGLPGSRSLPWTGAFASGMSRRARTGQCCAPFEMWDTTGLHHEHCLVREAA